MPDEVRIPASAGMTARSQVGLSVTFPPNHLPAIPAPRFPARDSRPAIPAPRHSRPASFPPRVIPAPRHSRPPVIPAPPSFPPTTPRDFRLPCHSRASGNDSPHGVSRNASPRHSRESGNDSPHGVSRNATIRHSRESGNPSACVLPEKGESPVVGEWLSFCRESALGRGLPGARASCPQPAGGPRLFKRAGCPRSRKNRPFVAGLFHGAGWSARP